MKKLPVVVPPTPAEVQRADHGLAVKPVHAGSRPEFPTRSELARATLLATGLAGTACGSPTKPPVAPPPADPVPAAAVEPAPAPEPAPPPDPAPAPAPPVIAEPAPPPEPPPRLNGSINGEALATKAPSFRVFREGGGIGPAEDMWQEEEVEAFINWTMAKDGQLDLETNYAFELDGVKFKLDGFDPVKNVGYEYVDKLDYDRDYFTKEVRAKFDAWMKERKVAILFIEVKKNPDAATLRGKILKFLAAVKKAPPAPKS